MRKALWALVGVGMLAGCVRELGGPTWDWDAEADAAEARSFLEKWKALGGRSEPAAQLARATMALQALSDGSHYRLPGLDAAALARQGRLDAQAAAQALPNDPAPARLMAGFELREGNLAAAAQAACRAADLAPRRADDQERCGDLLREQGDGPGAVQRYKQAILASTDHIQRWELIERIEQTSLQPKTDLAGLPAEIVEGYRAQQRPPPPPAHY